ncbi:potassium-transporting ATPase F subunit [Acidiphilium multivorum AIU301]|jgi:K+-transporting ATPase KdpF subunit|uniref:Potassium-transporting ATPase F subunit n=1 Tax=Acidiphilium multivorum (strain DSM 11245 / JCM 8867 / NBRC 100883 / AIU 301) TaxID=926570 RepID=F0IXA2_ACIMA|nr:MULTISPECIES: potassium-transporting ATPase subunit F [Acidiphilium]MBU6358256.1 potassium-transporting ATPase subunit F [Rhodospirillales bacterium]MDE2327966.1 potassium-transporting ATPase subunit F [Rhodospirillales bacterium]BAJ80512.1 potassium-transporting ATPase F subunit [Acidiphilium multivorum AIU301]
MTHHGGPSYARSCLRDLRPLPALRERLREDLTKAGSMIDLILSGIAALLILVYLVWALLRPEDF